MSLPSRTPFSPYLSPPPHYVNMCVGLSERLQGPADGNDDTFNYIGFRDCLSQNIEWACGSWVTDVHDALQNATPDVNVLVEWGVLSHGHGDSPLVLGIECNAVRERIVRAFAASRSHSMMLYRCLLYRTAALIKEGPHRPSELECYKTFFQNLLRLEEILALYCAVMELYLQLTQQTCRRKHTGR